MLLCASYMLCGGLQSPTFHVSALNVIDTGTVSWKRALSHKMISVEVN